MIKYVRLTGLIVAVDERWGRMVYTLDDSSGVNIEVTCAAPPKPLSKEVEGTGALNVAASTTKPASVSAPAKSTTALAPIESAAAEPQQLISPDGPNLTNIDVGSVVKVKGGIGIYRDQKQIRLKVITTLGDTNAEVKCWNDVATFRKDVLSKPWVVSAEEEEKCRLEVDREARWKIEEDAQRKKDRLRRHLKEKNRELREKYMQAKAEQENLSTRDELREKYKQAKAELENSRDKDDVARKRKIKDGHDEELGPENRVNYPSKAARRRAAGKYDALGI